MIYCNTVYKEPHVKSWLIGKDSDAGRNWGQEEKGMTEDEIAGWHHRLDGRESQWTPGVGDGQGGLACCDSRGPKESDTTERLIWSDMIWYKEDTQSPICQIVTRWNTTDNIYLCIYIPSETKSKGEEERYKHLNAEFQRIARRDKKAFLSNLCKGIEENNIMGKTRGLLKKIRDTKGTFHAKMCSIKDRNGMDLTEAEDIKKRWQEYTEELYKKRSSWPR